MPLTEEEWNQAIHAIFHMKGIGKARCQRIADVLAQFVVKGPNGEKPADGLTDMDLI